MAMAVGNAAEDAPIGDMNTTPLIDVMLVLLIMFIITIPVQTHAVKLDLPPPTNLPNTIKPDFNQVNIDFLNAIYWNNQEVTLEQLRGYLDTIGRMPLDDQPELRLKPEAMSKYDVTVKVMAQAQQAGITKMGFVGNEAYA
ncbi:biopolymer transporter ExbD [Sandaracinobacteroides saxicola]|uniref:Biopolymer transporter ExbD n=2 Tax=Sandaracinobacteroides saxicola TaxID=2759707 RepID=A0A7G5IL53_9SPHN|nr:biopolymer transporter ExbD [Sandaracinobacteroides saxicola]QMW24095.1 biopolymer transporter ExbD [Sandaracinobacteroides saxicola]